MGVASPSPTPEERRDEFKQRDTVIRGPLRLF
jgi:hypothetical protein